jgi:hypothetical protein
LKKAIASGNVPSMRPHQVVDTLINDKSLSLSDIDSTMRLLRQKNPEMADRVQVFALYDIFSKSARRYTNADNAAMIRGDLPNLDVKSLRTRIGLPAEGMPSDPLTRAERVSSIIGEDAYSDLIMLTKLLTPRGIKEEISPLGGSMTLGSIRSAFTRGTLKEKVGVVVDSTMAWVQAWAYTMPPTRKLITNHLWDPAAKAKMYNIIIASAPFWAATVEEFGGEKAQEMREDMRKMIEQNVLHYMTPAMAPSGYVDESTVPEETLMPQPPTLEFPAKRFGR